MAQTLTLVYARGEQEAVVVVREVVSAGEYGTFREDEADERALKLWLVDQDVKPLKALCARLEHITQGQPSVNAFCTQDDFLDLLNTLGLEHPFPEKVLVECGKTRQRKGAERV